MALDDMLDQLKRGMDRGVKQVKKTAESLETEARIFALHRKVGHRVFELWQTGQLSHPDLEEDLQQLKLLEARLEEGGVENDAATTTVSSPAGSSAAGASSGGSSSAACPHCSHLIYPGGRFCTACGKPV